MAYYTIQSDSIQLRPVENGFVLQWMCCYRVGMGTYDSMNRYEKEEEVFKDDEGAQALKRMKELFASSGEEQSEDDDE